MLRKIAKVAFISSMVMAYSSGAYAFDFTEKESRVGNREGDNDLLIFPDGTMVSLNDALFGIGLGSDFSQQLVFMSPTGDVLSKQPFHGGDINSSGDALKLGKHGTDGIFFMAAPNKDIWFADDDYNLFGWDNKSETKSKKPMQGNSGVGIPAIVGTCLLIRSHKASPAASIALATL